ncbi:hypothetical protein CMI47_16105 [Candidatus Pacearchaeota archaeon]|nr:hypothetical protein [Candidatus Pacearchaeota archaeon]
MTNQRKSLVIGNGESRAWFVPKNFKMSKDVVTWGCNAIYRDSYVDVLVAVDYAMQQEIYDSGYCLENPEWPEQGICYFSNWSIIPASIVDMMFLGYNIPETFIHRSKNRTDQCVITGKDPSTVQEKIETAILMNPHLDMDDLKLKMEKDIGIWITYVEKNDIVIKINYPIGWSAGNTALHLACQSSTVDYLRGRNVKKEVYVLGFDLGSYEEPLNNIYKGTDNYLPATAKGFNQENWYNQMQAVFKEFPHIKFYLVDSTVKIKRDNVSHITKNELCEALELVKMPWHYGTGYMATQKRTIQFK